MMLHNQSFMETEEQETSRKIPELDGLRGIAILLVIFHHLMPVSAVPGNLGFLFYPISTFGWSGVDLFFVLSGFLITGILLASKNKNGAKFFFINFYMRRSLRIFPIYFIFVGLCHLMHSRLGDFTPAENYFKYYYLYSQNWLEAFRGSSGFVSSGFGHLWSLAVEEQFYLVWPMVVYFAPRRVLLGVLLAVVALTPFWRLYINRASDVSDLMHLYSLSAFTRCDQLVWGALLAVLTARDGGIGERAVYVIAKFVLVASTLVLASLLVFGGFTAPQISNYSMRIWGYTAVGGFCFSLVFFAAFGEGRFAVVFKRILNWRLLSGAGAISYGMYIYHWPIQKFLMFVLREEPKMIRNAMVFLGTLFMTLLISLASFYYVERPFIALKKHFPR